MLTKVRNWSIGLKLSLGAFALIGALFLTFLVLISYGGARLAQREALREVGDKTRMLTESVNMVDRNLQQRVAMLARVFANEFKNGLALDATRSVEIGGRAVPVLKSGDKDVNLNFSIPDQFTALTGAYATVFVRSGDDFVRITTSHKKENGERAVGTELDHAHPAYRKILAGQSYAGAATLFGGQYMTRYDPITDSAGKVIGILYVGVDFTDSMKSFGESIKSMKLGQSGYFYAVNAKQGNQFGRILIHPTSEGADALAYRDGEGNAYVKAMLEKKQGDLLYRDKEGRQRLSAYASIEQWNLLVAGDVALDDIETAAREQRREYALLAFVLIALASGLTYKLIRAMVSRPLSQAVGVAETVAAGDLSSEIAVHSNDESGRLMAALQAMNGSLAAIVGDVRASTASIAAASGEIAAGNRDLSARTEQQAGTLEETVAAMEEMTAAVRQNADHVLQAQSLSQSAVEVAQKGSRVVEQVVGKMDAINESARRIVDIIAVIDGIAFQTNILALNAAVEAARAGEQGRGFAVVASEVRTLAQRSSQAAKEIKGLIGASVEQTNEGTVLVGAAGETMREIAGGITRVATLMEDIALSTREQSSGIEQINLAIGQMDDATRQNAAMVEQATAAAQSLHQQAERLEQVVGYFNLGGKAHDRQPALHAIASDRREPRLENTLSIEA